MKPLIFFIEDDEATTDLFTLSVPSEFEVRLFNDPLVALQALVEEKPWVIVSDQILPNLKGDEFLKLSRTLSPFSIRVLQTAHINERLLLDSIRKSQLNDFIKKPWPTEIMRARLDAAVDLYRINERYRVLGEETIVKDELLKDLSDKLQNSLDEFALFKKNESEMRREIECWAPPAIVAGIKNKRPPKAAKQTVITLAFSIPSEVTLPELEIEGRSIRFQLIRYFSDVISKYGGWRESSGGAGARITSAYFGLMGSGETMADAALAAALEFKTAVENIYNATGFQFPCYILVHLQDNVQIHVQTTLANTPEGPITQKNFEIFGIDYESIKSLRDVLKPLERATIVISDTVRSKLKNTNWGLVETAQPNENSDTRAFLVKFVPAENLEKGERVLKTKKFGA